MEEQQVEENRRNRADGHSGGDKDLCPFRESSSDIRLEGDQHGQAQRGRDDGGVAAVGDVFFRNGLQAGPRNVGEERQRGTAEHRGGDSRHHGGGLGQ